MAGPFSLNLSALIFLLLLSTIIASNDKPGIFFLYISIPYRNSQRTLTALFAIMIHSVAAAAKKPMSHGTACKEIFNFQSIYC